ncbi:MAG: FKBP-type peptidyl-prolyl cis-trans isomerase [Nitrososphaeria archaeon]
MPFEEGDFILLEFTAKIKDTGEIIDTTLEHVAKEGRIYQENKVYEPMLVIIGEGQLLKSLEDKLVLMELGESRIIELKPEESFGMRDPSKVRIISARELTARGIIPKPGMKIETEEGTALIRSVGGGRVVIDLNHPLAGKTLLYEIKIIKKISEKKEKILMLIHRRIPNIDVSKFDVAIDEDTITINIPSEAYLLEGIQYIKRNIANDVGKFFRDISKVQFVESYEVKRTGT